jgi:hypothetical protein
MSNKIFTTAILLLALCVSVTSLGGLLIPDMYARETGDWMAQSIGQDIFDLFIGVPALLVSFFLYRRGSRIGFFFLVGILIFLIYTFIIYALGIHFNRFFILYCNTLALANYSLIYLLRRVGSKEVKSWFPRERKNVLPAVYLLFFAVLFYSLWLSSIIPSIANNTVPKDLETIGLMTNPVHVLDLSFLLPGFIITAILLLRKHSLGYLFVPAIMTFSVFMTLSIATLVIYEYEKGFTGDLFVAIAMVFFTLVSCFVFVRFTKGIGRTMTSSA